MSLKNKHVRCCDNSLLYHFIQNINCWRSKPPLDDKGRNDLLLLKLKSKPTNVVISYCYSKEHAARETHLLFLTRPIKHKWSIWLVEWGKMMALHVLHALWYHFLDVREVKKRWRQRRATTTSPVNNMIGWVRKNNRAAGVVRFLVKFFVVVCRTTSWNFHTWSFILFLSTWKPIVPIKWKDTYFAYFFKNDQHGIIAKHLTLRIGRFRSFLNSL